MRKRQHDVKFVIYQALYLVVISLITIKGAEIDLTKVEKAGASDSLRVALEQRQRYNDSLAAEIAKQEEAARRIQEELARKQAEDERIRQEMERLRKGSKDLPLSVTQAYIQYTWNTAKNSGTVPVEIYDPKDRSKPIAVIGPGEEKRFDLGGQTEVIAKFGMKEQAIPVAPNKPPVIRIEKVTTKMEGSRIRLAELQAVSCFKVTIEDERPDQLKASFTGPVTATGPTRDSRGNLIYFVTPSIARTEEAFQAWVDKHGDAREADGRYKVNFFLNVSDSRTGEKFPPTGGSVYFTDFK